MLLNNPIIIENEAGEEVNYFNSEGHPCCYPVSFFSPFKIKDAFIRKDDMVGFKTPIKEALCNMKENLKKLDGSEIDDNYGIKIKDTIESMIESIREEKFPETYIVVMYYGFFGDLMTIQDVQNLIPEVLKR